MNNQYDHANKLREACMRMKKCRDAAMMTKKRRQARGELYMETDEPVSAATPLSSEANLQR